MRQHFANTSAFSEPAFFLSDTCIWSTSRKEKSRSMITPRYSWEPETAHKMRCSRIFLWPAWQQLLQQRDERVAVHMHRGEEASGCHNLCKPTRCSEAGLLMTQRKIFQSVSPICSPPWGTCPSTLFQKLNGKPLCEWAWLSTISHWPCSFLG